MNAYAPKLVRDRIPDIIVAKGGTCVSHVASDTEYRAWLKEKLREEVAEFLEAENVEELADVREVLDAYAAALGITPEDASRTQAEKREKRGGFGGKIVLESW